MTVVAQDPFNEYTANGATTAFGFEFEVKSASHLKVKVNGALVSSGYTVSGVGVQAGGTVTFDDAPAADTEILLYREVPLSRSVAYTTNGPFPATTVNLDFDLIWMVLQQLKSDYGGVLRVPYPATVDEIPAAADRMGKLLGFNSASGQPEASTFTMTQVASVVAAVYAASAGPLDALTYLQGGAGAVARSPQDRLRERVSVKDFGAVADSTNYNDVGTDSSAAFQAAIDYALSISADVYVPAGKYYAHDLEWGQPANWPAAGGGVTGKGIRLLGDDKQVSVIYTDGNDFMDVRTAQIFAASNITVMSKVVAGAPTGKGIWSSATTAETGYVRPRIVIVDLHNVEFSRFDIAVDSDGAWTSKIDYSRFYFNRIGLFMPRSYNVDIRNNDFACQTAIKWEDAPTAVNVSDNHFGVGTWKDIFGSDETTLDLALGNAVIQRNYFENYGSVAAPGTILWRFSMDGSSNFEVSHNHVNMGSGTMVLRKMRRTDGIDAQLNCSGKFHHNRLLAPSLDEYWRDELGASARLFFNDDVNCTLVGSKINPSNLQKLTASKTNISYVKGTTEPTPSITGFDTYKVIGDVNMAPSGGTLVLQRGTYRISVTARGYCTPVTPSDWKKMFLRFSTGSLTRDFKLVDDASGAAAFNSTTHYTFIASETILTPTYYFPVTPDAGDEFTISELTVVVEPIAVFGSAFAESV